MSEHTGKPKNLIAACLVAIIITTLSILLVVMSKPSMKIMNLYFMRQWHVRSVALLHISSQPSMYIRFYNTWISQFRLFRVAMLCCYFLSFWRSIINLWLHKFLYLRTQNICVVHTKLFVPLANYNFRVSFMRQIGQGHAIVFRSNAPNVFHFSMRIGQMITI